MEATLERSRLSIAESVARVNARRCQVQPIYGRDLHKAFDIIGRFVCHMLSVSYDCIMVILSKPNIN